MKLPLKDILVKDVAEKALDDISYEGKSIREWIDILVKLKSNEDCISREDAINSVHKYFKDYLKLNDDICLDGLRSLPPVLPKGVTVTDFADRCRECGAEYGKMLEASKPKGGIWASSSNGWMCSNCRQDASQEFDFCPHCGADMRGTRESEDDTNELKEN